MTRASWIKKRGGAALRWVLAKARQDDERNALRELSGDPRSPLQRGRGASPSLTLQGAVAHRSRYFAAAT
ncbi:MAG TPA: hypothetical protein VF959_02370, partial [Casimicrobiaceae bacterium]